jgi:hypothetical protein
MCQSQDRPFHFKERSFSPVFSGEASFMVQERTKFVPFYVQC